MNHGILHLSCHGHGSWLLILFGLFSLMSVIGFVTATPITAGAFVAWGPILLALAILLAVLFRSGERQSST